MNSQKKLKAIFDELLAEVGRNDGLREQLTSILEGSASDGQLSAKRSARRKPGRFDPMAIYRERPEDLAPMLDALTIEELKDIIAENGMDRTKLAMKWKAKDRLIELIASVAKSRAQKGDAFRTDTGQPSSDAASKGDHDSSDES